MLCADRAWAGCCALNGQGRRQGWAWLLCAGQSGNRLPDLLVKPTSPVRLQCLLPAADPALSHHAPAATSPTASPTPRWVVGWLRQPHDALLPCLLPPPVGGAAPAATAQLAAPWLQISGSIHGCVHLGRFCSLDAPVSYVPVPFFADLPACRGADWRGAAGDWLTHGCMCRPPFPPNALPSGPAAGRLRCMRALPPACLPASQPVSLGQPSPLLVSPQRGTSAMQHCVGYEDAPLGMQAIKAAGFLQARVNGQACKGGDVYNCNRAMAAGRLAMRATNAPRSPRLPLPCDRLADGRRDPGAWQPAYLATAAPQYQRACPAAPPLRPCRRWMLPCCPRTPN